MPLIWRGMKIDGDRPRLDGGLFSSARALALARMMTLTLMESVCTPRAGRDVCFSKRGRSTSASPPTSPARRLPDDFRGECAEQCALLVDGKGAFAENQVAERCLRLDQMTRETRIR